MKKILSLTMIIIIALVMCMENVYADGESCNLEITIPGKLEAKAGDTIDVSFSTKNLNVGTTKGLYMIEGKIEYDTKVFETITQSSISMKNGWQIEQFTNDNRIIIYAQDYVKTAGELFSVAFKVKSSVTAGQTSIAIKNVTASTDSKNALTIPETSFLLTTSGTNVPTSTVPSNRYAYKCCNSGSCS